MLILLPLAAALLLSAEGFDSSRCKEEMVCFIPGSCSTPPITDLMQSKEKIEECEAVVAIRRYSEKKWLVVMRRASIDPNGIRFLFEQTAESLLFECKPNGELADITVGSDLTKGRQFVATGTQSIECEFEVSSSKPFPELIPYNSKDSVVLQLAARWTMKTYLFNGPVESTERCDPDLIKFDNVTSATESYQEVDGRRFNVSCPEGWRLTLKNGTGGYQDVARVGCAVDPDAKTSAIPPEPKFRYQVGRSSAADPEWLPKDEPIGARCARKRCVTCPAVGCSGAGCIAPNWTRGAGDSCAKLECEGNRFELAEGGKVVAEPVCLDDEWSLNGAPFKTAGCFKEHDCRDITAVCPTCKPSLTDFACAGAKEEMTIVRKDGSSAPASEGFKCDRATGQWMTGATPLSDKDTVACASVARVSSAGSKAGQIVFGVLLSSFCAMGLVVVFVTARRMQRRKPISAVTTTNASTEHPEENGRRRRRRSRDRNDDGASSATTTAQSNTRSGATTSGSSTKTEHSLATAIPIPPPEPKKKRPATHSAEYEQLPPPKSSAGPKQQGCNPQPAEPAPMEDDHGYVVIDPEAYAAELAAAAAAKTMAAAAAAAKTTAATAAAKTAPSAAGGSGSTQKVGVIPPPGRSSASEPGEKTAAPPSRATSAAAAAAAATEQPTTEASPKPQ